MSKCLRMSASCISCFKRCKMAFFYQYMLGLRPVEETDALRIGSVYHMCREIIGTMSTGVTECWHKCHRRPKAMKSPCMICGEMDGPGKLQADPIMQVMVYLNNYYESRPDWHSGEKMRAERAMLLNAMVGYEWRYSADESISMLGNEFKGEQPIFNPHTGEEVDDAVLVYVCDGIMKHEGMKKIREFKTTSKGVDSDSTFWQNLTLNIQPNMYIYCLQQAQRAGQLIPLGIKPDDPLISDIMYDVFHKPGIKPKALSQGDSKQFVEDGLYMGTEFTTNWQMDNTVLEVDGEIADVKPGKKDGTFAIHETGGMYGARLLADIVERPDFYLARRNISKTEADMKRTELQLYNIYQSIRSMEREHAWYHEEEACEATFKCPFIGLCYNNIDVEGMLAAGQVPEGFTVYKREEKDASTT